MVMQTILQIVMRMRGFMAECHDKMMTGRMSHLTGYAVVATFVAGLVIGMLIG